MRELRIVFMGTPEFAAGILNGIIKAGYTVAGVVTAADKPAGRGQKIRHSAVKEYCIENNIKIMQPVSLKDPEFIAELKALEANLQVVVAFRMLPEIVWQMPQYGTFNLHASLLPDYRGAAPINWAIINGEKTTGVTTFFIDREIDTGNIILSKSTPILEDEDAGSLHDRLSLLGSEAVNETLELIATDSVQQEKQSDSPGLKAAPKLHKDNCRIDWTQSGKRIKDLVRGLSPFPGAWSAYNDGQQEIQVKIFKAEYRSGTGQRIGTPAIDGKELLVGVCDGQIAIQELQMPGKKKMSAAEWLNGNRIAKEAKFL